MLKVDPGAGKRVTVVNLDDLFKLGVDSIDVKQFGYIDV